MHFVGPRPERPEFVEWLSKEIPYYGVRHVVRPGITGWAQVQYKYGNTLEDAREKLQYDLFYIKNASLGLDLLIMFQTHQDCAAGPGSAMRWMFWGAAFLIAYTYRGLCGLVVAAGAARPWPVRRASAMRPHVSIVMVVRNEERGLESKLRNLLELDYPAGALPDCGGLRWIDGPDRSDSARVCRRSASAGGHEQLSRGKAVD